MSISRNASQAQKTQAYKLSELMTRLLKDNITWLRASMDNVPACKYDYLQTMYTMVSLLLLEDRPHASLHTPLALTFDRRGGTEILLEDLEVIWSQISKVHAIAKDQRTTEQQELLPRMYGSLEMLLTVLVYISSPKLVHDSPSTAPIVQRDRKSADYFDPYEWIIGMQLKLSTVKKYFESPDLDQFSRTVLHVLLDIVLEILKGEGESSLKHESFTPSTTHSTAAAAAAAFASSPFHALRTPPPPVVADARGVQTLVDMGFDRAAAEQAMVRCNNQISRAVDYLFSHPQPVLANAGRNRNTDEDGGEDDNDEPMHDSSVHDESDHDSDHEEEQPTTQVTEQQQQQREDMDQEESSSNNNNSSKQEEEDQKQKEAELAKNVEALQQIRSNMKKDIPPLVLDLVDKREDLLFDIRGLLVAFCNNDDSNHKVAADIMTLLISRIKQVGEKSPDSPVLGTRLRLLALFYKESAMQPVIPRIPSELSFLFDMVNSIGDNADTPLPPWFTTVFLVLEAVISQAEEPRKEKLVKPSNGNGNDDSMSDVVEEQQKDDDEVDDQPQQTVIDVSQRTRLLNNCVTFLQRTKLTRNEIYAILRVVVHLTKDYDAASKFVEYGGLPLLFAKPRTSLDGIQGQQAFVLLILRHIIESPALLQTTMEELLTTWFTVPRPRQMEAKAFIRTNAHLALRDPNAFLKAVEHVGSLTHYDKHMQTYNVKLRSEDDSNENVQSTDNNATITTSSSSDPDVNMEAAVVPDQQQQSQAKASSSSSSSSAVVVNHLLNELLSIRATEESTNKSTDEEKKAENQRYAYIAFLLQCLVELVQSYKSCKYDIYAFGRRRGSKDGNTSNKTRSSILHMLLNDLLPYNAINPNTEESRKQQGVSMWAASLLVAMCYESPAPKKSDNSGDDLAQVRKYVFDGIIRSLKETVASSSGTLAAKYGKFLALSDLCHRLLNARPNTLSSQRGGGPLGGGASGDEESIMSVAKIMVDKNFVGSLTAAISDVDINYPHAKTVLNSMLRPLEQLTKLATKIPDDAGSKEDGDKKRGEILSYDVSASTDTEAEDTPDLYRNSALGMFDGSVMEEDEMDEFESEEEDEETQVFNTVFGMTNFCLHICIIGLMRRNLMTTATVIYLI